MHGTVVVNLDGTLTYTPQANFHGVDLISYVVSDGDDTGVGLVTVTVNAVNDDPVAGDDAAGGEIRRDWLTSGRMTYCLGIVTKNGLVPPYAPQGYESDMPAFERVLTDEEIAAARQAQWQLVSLGPRVLRVETAALVLAGCGGRPSADG